MVTMEVLTKCDILAKRDRDQEVEQATRIGLENAKKLLQSLSQVPQQAPHLLDKEASLAAGAAISKFQKVVSLLSRTGHARFRRGPSASGSSVAKLSNVFIDSKSCKTEDMKRKRDFPGGVGCNTPPYSPPVSSDLLIPSQHYQQKPSQLQV